MGKVADSKTDVVRQIPMACADETAAVEFLEEQRWGDNPGCPHCGADNVYQMTKRGSDERNDRLLWRCRECSKQYTVRVGTIMEDSPIPLRHWCFAFWAACSSKKGVSAKQIERQTGLSYKSALFLMHRIRWAMSGSSGGGPLSGIVEADETYVGGKRRGGPSGRPARTSHKTPVFAMVERDGNVRAYPVANVTGATLKGAIRENVCRTSRVMTDEYASYKGLDDEFAAHETIPHRAKEYARGDVTTNTVEAFFALLKRGVIGVYHNVSREHLHRYVTGAEFLWNTRKLDDGARISKLIEQCEGKRLMYRHP